MNETVLFVDDDSSFLDAVRRALRGQEFTVCTATSAAQALQIMRELEVAVLVSDLRMPDGDGLALLQAVRSHHPNVVGVMLSGKLSLESAKLVVNRAGATRLFEKPVRYEELLVGIRGALAEHRHRRSRARSFEILSMQSSFIEHLEREHPGISTVKRDDQGRVILALPQTSESE